LELQSRDLKLVALSGNQRVKHMTQWLACLNRGRWMSARGEFELFNICFPRCSVDVITFMYIYF